MATRFSEFRSNGRVAALGTSLFGLWLFYQSLFFTVTIAVGIPPDETEHLTIIRAWLANPGLFLPDTASTEMFGPLSQRAPLYYIIAAGFGAIGQSLLPGASEAAIYRILSTIANLGTFILLSRLTWLVTRNSLTTIIAAGVLSNILMFSFLGASVNYDSLLILATSLSFYFAANAIQERSWNWVLASIIALTVASLIKVAALPLFALIPGMLVIGWSFDRKPWPRPRISAAFVSGLLALLVFGCWSFSIHGVNLLRHGEIYPTCLDVKGVEWCVAKVPEARVNYELKARGEKLNGFEFARRYFKLFEERIFGIFGHAEYRPRGRALWPRLALYFFVVIGFVCFLLSNKSKENRKVLWSAFAVSALFLSVCLLQNYSRYLDHGQFGAGLQGRYIFPVILPLLLITAQLASTGIHTIFRRFDWIMAALLLAAFVRYGFPEFVGRKAFKRFIADGVSEPLSQASSVNKDIS